MNLLRVLEAGGPLSRGPNSISPTVLNVCRDPPAQLSTRVLQQLGLSPVIQNDEVAGVAAPLREPESQATSSCRSPSGPPRTDLSATSAAPSVPHLPSSPSNELSHSRASLESETANAHTEEDVSPSRSLQEGVSASLPRVAIDDDDTYDEPAILCAVEVELVSSTLRAGGGGYRSEVTTAPVLPKESCCGPLSLVRHSDASNTAVGALEQQQQPQFTLFSVVVPREILLSSYHHEPTEEHEVLQMYVPTALLEATTVADLEADIEERTTCSISIYCDGDPVDANLSLDLLSPCAVLVAQPSTCEGPVPCERMHPEFSPSERIGAAGDAALSEPFADLFDFSNEPILNRLYLVPGRGSETSGGVDLVELENLQRAARIPEVM